ncbi:GNAT family N-acetyltransferase [Niallia taxi]|uniref:GNAT family N-acetyltransferase n=1 Tax=Niallia taxi TaxID=2499688 RepID=UPI0015F756DB|nr:GNAT family N-acetyltransferase [Niallia taxi]
MVIEQIERPSWSGDIKEILSPHKEAFGFNDVPDNLPLNSYQWWRIKNDAGTSLGVAYVSECELNEFSQREAEISICVREQSKGAGSKLLAFLEENAKNKGFDVTAAVIKEKNQDHDNVVKWFEGKGYKIAPSSEDTVMLKKLDQRSEKHGSL